MHWALIWILISSPVFGLGFANGVKIGEVDSTSAVIWTRLTKEAEQEPFHHEQGGAVPGAKGGFLSVSVSSGASPVATIRHHDVLGKMVNETKVLPGRK